MIQIQNRSLVHCIDRTPFYIEKSKNVVKLIIEKFFPRDFECGRDKEISMTRSLKKYIYILRSKRLSARGTEGYNIKRHDIKIRENSLLKIGNKINIVPDNHVKRSEKENAISDQSSQSTCETTYL